MFRKLWTTAVLTATALGFAAATAAPATAGIWVNHCEPLIRRRPLIMEQPPRPGSI